VTRVERWRTSNSIRKDKSLGDVRGKGGWGGGKGQHEVRKGVKVSWGLDPGEKRRQ